jgi:hypothetical protein
MRLTASQVKALYILWESGYENPITCSALLNRHFNVLAKLGYAESDPTDKKIFRITESGILRIIDPAALLVKEVMES